MRRWRSPSRCPPEPPEPPEPPPPQHAQPPQAWLPPCACAAAVAAAAWPLPRPLPPPLRPPQPCEQRHQQPVLLPRPLRLPCHLRHGQPPPPPAPRSQQRRGQRPVRRRGALGRGLPCPCLSSSSSCRRRCRWTFGGLAPPARCGSATGRKGQADAFVGALKHDTRNAAAHVQTSFGTSAERSPPIVHAVPRQGRCPAALSSPENCRHTAPPISAIPTPHVSSSSSSAAMAASARACSASRSAAHRGAGGTPLEASGTVAD